jgi:cytidylate kinase
MRKRPVVAIDGPAASGKSTTARAVAKALGFTHLDSGALYRALTFVALERLGPAPRWEAEAIVAEARRLPVSVAAVGGVLEVVVGGLPLGDAIRSEAVTREVSRVAAMGPVRGFVNDLLHAAAAEGGVVMDGRDIGTVVFPRADVKIYLEPTEDLRRTWKVQRDTAKRGYTVEAVSKSLEKRKFDSVNFIQPQRTFADMVVSFYRPEGRSEESGAHLHARHILRPTLPHPDLTPILEAGGKKGLRLELARDIDGKPVDVLDISGDIDDKRAQSMEDLLWSLIPEAQVSSNNFSASVMASAYFLCARK